MAHDQKYSCTKDLGAELLVIIISILVTLITTLRIQWSALRLMIGKTRNIDIDFDLDDQNTNSVLSTAYALLLPLMTYLFSQANQYYSEGRAQVILIWMVFIEIIRIRGDPIFAWSFRKSAEQFVRILWVSFLILSFTSLSGIKASLLILCALFAIYVILKGIIFHVAKNSNLIGKNPTLIHNYVKKPLLKDDLQTTPLNNCDYIVLGEENRKISVRDNGYHLSKKKSVSSICVLTSLFRQKKPKTNGVLTIGRVFQLESSEDEKFTSAYPKWRDTCLSFALAKILRCRFAKLSLDETDCTKSLDFVLKLIDYTGSNDEERNPTPKVLCIIQEELNFISDFLQMRMPIIYSFPLYFWYELIIGYIVFGSGIYLIYAICKNISTWLSFVAQDASNTCFFQTVRSYRLLKTLSQLDQTITIFLFAATLYINFVGIIMDGNFEKWYLLHCVESYILYREWRSSLMWLILYIFGLTFRILGILSSLFGQLILIINGEDVTESQVHPTVLDMGKEKIFLFLPLYWSIILHLPKCVRRRIPIPITIVQQSADAKKATLMSLKESKGQLTNGKTSISKHGMDHLDWACRPHQSTTKLILVWHIATTLFHHKTTNTTNQEHSPAQSDNPSKKQQIALELSCYCHHLVAYRPELLPDEVEYTKSKYEDLRREILGIDKSSCQKNPTKHSRCIYVLQDKQNKNSIIGKGANLARDLITCAKNGAQVWEMLADFWAELMLYVAPSDNVEAHQKRLERDELITQLWALLTHAGILSRPKPTEHNYEESDDDSEQGPSCNCFSWCTSTRLEK